MKILIGYILDLIFGDPYSIPHPIVLIGKSISKLENFLRGKVANERLAGLLLNIGIVIPAYIIPSIILIVLSRINIYLAGAIEIFMIYQILATKSLGKESRKVYYPLLKEDIWNARKYLSYIVGRNTDLLDEKEIIRATVETIAENISDGIIAPLFYIAVGGAPLGFAYKAINTLDSMVGYKNDKYKDFGYVSAKVDDLANLGPARMTGLLISLGSVFLGMDYKNSIQILFRDGRNHSSPNAGFPEAATAGALRVRLGGTNTYFGKKVYKPTIGDNHRELEIEDINRTIKIMYATSILGMLSVLVIKILI